MELICLHYKRKTKMMEEIERKVGRKGRIEGARANGKLHYSFFYLHLNTKVECVLFKNGVIELFKFKY